MSARPVPLEALPAGLVWRGARLAGTPPAGRPSGFAALDAVLPGGGWPEGALVELLCDQPGAGELSLLLPQMRQVAAPRWLVWVAPPFIPYAPALALAGVPLERLLWVAPDRPQDIRWAARQALLSGSCTMVLAWQSQLDMAALRRLQLAAEQGHTPLFLFRERRVASQPSPAVLRLQLEAGDDGTLSVQVLKRRGPLLAGPVHLSLAGRSAPRATRFEPAGAAPAHRSRTRARFRPGLSPEAQAALQHAVARPDPARTRPAGQPARVD
ncbi:MAG: translesion DNA synthesis-associated protein ImuA [Rhodocyclaceae bacterium]|nr:translesion DNA synthesis-associated protein ImuA [Rhodocyclaceae bacterium]